MEETGGQAASVFGAATLTRPLRPHQQRALAAFETDRQRGNAATYLVVPPGGGKTLIGLEVARPHGRLTVVLCPNTAIQAARPDGDDPFAVTTQIRTLWR